MANTTRIAIDDDFKIRYGDIVRNERTDELSQVISHSLWDKIKAYCFRTTQESMTNYNRLRHTVTIQGNIGGLDDNMACTVPNYIPTHDRKLRDATV